MTRLPLISTPVLVVCLFLGSMYGDDKTEQTVRQSRRRRARGKEGGRGELRGRKGGTGVSPMGSVCVCAHCKKCAPGIMYGGGVWWWQLCVDHSPAHCVLHSYYYYYCCHRLLLLLLKLLW